MKDTPFLRLVLLLLLAFSFSASQMQAQEVLLSDFPSNSFSQAKALADRMAAKSTGGASLPLWEDFSYDSLKPNPAVWEIPANLDHVPTISNQKGLNPPTKGVCSFDGATFSGGLYAEEFSTGAGDSLLSLTFDLSTYSPADSIYLSFFVQRGGRNDIPESSDSLILYFDLNGSGDFVRVWGMGGASVADPAFARQMVPVTDATYLHSGFRFLFVNFGSQNGEYDVWHLDLVEMRANRTLVEQQPIDVSPTQVVNPPLAPYTAVPLDHFGIVNAQPVPSVSIYNSGTAQSSVSATMQISDPSGLNTFTGTTTQSISSFGLLGETAQIVAPSTSFSSQSPNLSQFGAYRLRTIVSANADSHAENDTLDFVSGIDSVLAFDDGVCDAAYGLTAARSFCQEYRVSTADTLTAVWIYFTPFVYVTPQGVSYSLENRQFRLSVWDTLVVDSFILQTSQGMLIEYGNGLNAFKRYPLSTPLVVDTLFWLGLRQVDAVPVGIGFDRNFDLTNVYYESSNGAFVPTTNSGTLMIRPEFARAKSATASAQNPSNKEYGLKVFPNPSGPENRFLEWEGGLQVRDCQMEVFTVDGRLVWKSGWPGGTKLMELPADKLQGAGMYWVRLTGKDVSGKIMQHSASFVVE